MEALEATLLSLSILSLSILITIDMAILSFKNTITSLQNHIFYLVESPGRGLQTSTSLGDSNLFIIK